MRQVQAGRRGDRLNAITLADVRAASKPRDAWWTVLLVDPIACRLVVRAAKYRWITPNRLTAAAALLGLGAAGAFALGGRWWYVVGALAYYLSFVVDCMDGKLARLTGAGSVFGQWLDFMLDRILVVVCAGALLGGQYARTGQMIYLALCGAVIFLNLFHQLNGQIMSEALRRAREKLTLAADGDTGESTNRNQRSKRSAVSLLYRVRESLARRRIRLDVFSAIEFQMAVFILAPLTGLIVPVTAFACGLLLAFDIAAVAKFAMSARVLTKELRVSLPPGSSSIPSQTFPGENRLTCTSYVHRDVP